jgi:hypothetical protein
MEKEFIPYQQALELKELGFDEPCIKYYWTDGMFAKGYEDPFNYNKRDNVISAPTYSQAFRWFREVYGLHGGNTISTNMWTTFSFYIDDIPNKNPIATHLDFNTPEEAELACLIKLIEIVKEKK